SDLLNLLKNSSEAMPQGGNITATTSKRGNQLRIILSDTGTGIPKEIMDNLFIPFFTTKEEGTGLGLAVCHGIIKAYGGTIKFESEKGKGTRVMIDLPISKKGADE
ncbi:MAG: ATP-binding protein, partial [Candidatus Omnitrophica bacterium]|nr:ATP-binding protein [Candidatus Omnitrophota bacterium]